VAYRYGSDADDALPFLGLRIAHDWNLTQIQTPQFNELQEIVQLLRSVTVHIFDIELPEKEAAFYNI
jgi:hypothetical protein